MWWPFRFVAVPVCGRFGLWPFRSVAVSVCGRSGLWPFWSVAVSVCGHFGLWPFWFVAVSVVAVSVCGRYDLLPLGFCSKPNSQNWATLQVAYHILSKPCLLMSWQLKEAEHQQIWYWSNRTEYSASSIRQVKYQWQCNKWLLAGETIHQDIRLMSWDIYGINQNTSWSMKILNNSWIHNNYWSKILWWLHQQAHVRRKKFTDI